MKKYQNRSHKNNKIVETDPRNFSLRFVTVFLFIPVCLPLLFSACDPLNGQNSLIEHDTVQPIVIIESPLNGEPYAPMVTITGSVTDYADNNNPPAAGRVDSCTWRLNNSTETESVVPATDGSFSFDVSTEGCIGTVTVTVTAVDWNGNSYSAFVFLDAPKAITRFVFPEESNQPFLTEDAEACIEGTDITVPVPEGSPIDNLVAAFEITGVAVSIGAVEQVNGETPNDFSEPVEYIVEANDGSKEYYLVTVVAVPLVPTDFAASVVNPGQIDLHWTDRATNETGYEIERSADDGSFEPLAMLEPNSYEYSDTSLSGGAVYTYRLQAVNNDGCSAWVDCSVEAMPEAPTNPTATAVSETEISLVWEDNSSIESSYEVERKNSLEDFRVLAASLPADETGYSDIGPLGGETWTYRVRAVNGSTGSGWAEFNQVTIQEMRIDALLEEGVTVSFVSLALDDNGRPHASYCDEDNFYLKYAWYDGTLWRGQVSSLEPDTLDSSSAKVGLYTSLELDGGGNPHISYQDRANEHLKYLRWDGTAWVGQASDSAPDVVDSSTKSGYFSSLALDDNDRPHIGYTDWGVCLKYIRWDGSAWEGLAAETGPDIIDSQGREYTSMVLDSSGNPCIAYKGGGQKYARWDGTAWKSEMVEGDGEDRNGSSLILDGDERPCISYYDNTGYKLLFVRWDGTAWVGLKNASGPDIVDADTGGYGRYTSLAIDQDGYPHIGYIYDGSGTDELRHAWWDGVQWQTEVIYTETDSMYCSLVVDTFNRVRILNGSKYYRDIRAVVE